MNPLLRSTSSPGAKRTRASLQWRKTVARKRKVSAESNGDTAAVENIASTAVQWYRVNAIPQVATDSVVSAVNSAAVSGRIKMLADRMPCSIAVRGFAACDVIGSNDEGSIVAVERFVYILADDGS